MSKTESTEALLRKAIIELKEMRSKLAAHERARSEPIAIVGMDCRFPGGSNDPESYWRMLREGVDAITEVPKERWDVEALYDADPEAPGKVATRWGAFLDGVDRFDPTFFGISPREAAAMDPQQRLLLEVSWRALEDAGQVPEKLAGSLTGVFVGLCTNDYSLMQLGDASRLERLDAYSGTGTSNSMCSGRVSYLLDLRGPSVVVDTACSSSLVALHMAVQSLRNRECDLALAAGVNTLLSPNFVVGISRMRMMAGDGRCKTFDAAADGFVQGEGCGVVVLKRLSDAQRDGDRIVALIRGSAVNQDGRSAGITAPNGMAQQAVIRAALENARVEPSQVGYVEAHGTGTSLGDPIEVDALSAVLGQPRPEGSPCVLGSVKTNIGHLQGAAGIAGVIKVALALRHGEIPAHLNFRQLNPSISFEGTPFVLPLERRRWPAGEKPRVAGVSSFGWSGTNAHAVLEEAPRSEARPTEVEGQAVVLPLSARSEEALARLAGAYARALAEEGAPALGDVVYTAGARRGHHEYRGAVAGRTRQQVVEGLEALARGEARAGVVSGRKPLERRRKVAFVFPGQGGQWKGMGKRLLEEEKAFREAVEACEAAMKPHVEWSLVKALRGEEGEELWSRIDFVQPALFAVGVGLAALWRSWGVEPDAVVGHSMGEVAAAYVAGVLSLEDAARVICVRSRLLRGLSGQGAMGVVELTADEAREELKGYEDRLAVAVSNSRRGTVLSGDAGALDEVLEKLKARGVFTRRVKVDVASHSPQVDVLRQPLLEGLQGLAPGKGKVALHSTVKGEVTTGEEMGAAYWVDNLRQPVLFHRAVKQLAEAGCEVVVELGPHPVLLSAVEETLREEGVEGGAVASMRREEDEGVVAREALGQVYAHGHEVRWARLHASGQCVRLPTYPFQRERYWLEQGSGSTRRTKTSGHPLLGRHLESSLQPGTHFWETGLGLSSAGFLDDHRVQGLGILPGTGYVEMALAAATQAFDASPVLEQVRFLQALLLPEEGERTVQLALTREEAELASFRISSRASEDTSPEAEWTLHASGSIRLAPALPVVAATSLEELRARCTEVVSGAVLYQALASRGIDFGPTFQGIERLWRRDGESLALLRPADEVVAEAGLYQLHPALLDQGFQALAGAVPAQWFGDDGGPVMPVQLERLRLLGSPRDARWAHAVQKPGTERQPGSFEGDLFLLGEQGQVLVEALGLRVQRLEAVGGRDVLDSMLLELQWQAATRPTPSLDGAPPEARGRWLVLVGPSGPGEALARRLVTREGAPLLVAPGERYRARSPERYEVNPARAEDFARLLEEAFGPGQPPCRGVVHLWSLEAGAGVPGLEALESAQDLTGVSTMHLVQALAGRGWRNMPRLWLVTAGAQAVLAGEVPSVAQSFLWGLGRVISYENPELGVRRVDIGRDVSPEEVEGLVGELATLDAEDQVALRGQARLVARLVRGTQRSLEVPVLDGSASYLLTGGLGGVGLKVARWLAERGARSLVLLGRGGPSPSATEELEALRALGVQVTLVRADVSRPEELSRALEEVERTLPPLKGVVHMAVVLEDGILVKLDRERFRKVMAPKVAGAWNLHQLTRERPLDFFVLFSSAASLIGSPGQGNYAAANAFLDALAHQRRAQGLPAVSINWGPWSQVGQAAAQANRGERMAQQGMRSFSPEQGVEVLGRLLQRSAAQVGVVPLDVRQWREAFPAQAESPYLSLLVRESSGRGGKARGRGLFKTALLAEEPSRRQALLTQHLREQVAQVLRMEPSRVEPEAPFGGLGLDSMMGLEVRNRLEASLGLTLPATLLWAYPTLQALTPHLAAKLELEAPPPSAPAPEAPPETPALDELAARVEQLSESELDALLLQKLQNL